MEKYVSTIDLDVLTTEQILFQAQLFHHVIKNNNEITQTSQVISADLIQFLDSLNLELASRVNELNAT